MIVKVLMVMCVLRVAVGKDQDSVVASIFGATEPGRTTGSTTTEDLDAVISAIFGSTKSSEATSETTDGIKDLDAVLSAIFGATKSSEATSATTEGIKDLDSVLNGTFESTKSSEATKTTTEGIKDLDSVIDDIFGSTKPTEATPTWVKTNDPCVNSEGEKGECIPYYNCRIEPLDVDEYYIDIHLPVDSPCESYLDMCCAHSNRIDVTTEPAKVGENSEPPK